MNNNLYNGMNYIPNQNINNIFDKYVEAYLKEKIGKNIEVHASFCDAIEWRDSIFTGILESVGKDYIAIKKDNHTYLIWSIYLDYIIISS